GGAGSKGLPDAGVGRIRMTDADNGARSRELSNLRGRDAFRSDGADQIGERFCRVYQSGEIALSHGADQGWVVRSLARQRQVRTLEMEAKKARNALVRGGNACGNP